MAATVARVIGEHIEACGLGLMAYRNRAPQGAVLPYVVVYERIGSDLQYLESHGVVVEDNQVDLWQSLDDERYSLPDDLTKALLAARSALGRAGSGVTHIAHLTGALRVPPAEDADRVKDTWTLTVSRTP